MRSLTRGAQPAGVYWRRRLFVVGSVLALVLLAVNVVRGWGGDPSPPGQATQVAAEPSTPTSTSTPAEPDDPEGATTAPTPAPGSPDRTSPSDAPTASPEPTPKPEPPEPEGYCEDGDIAISPKVKEAVAGQPVTVTLELRTRTATACTWRVSANHLAVKVTSGSDEIWTSRECPKQLPQTSVVVRRDFTSTLDLTWNARRSGEGCPAATEWAEPGWYHVTAAAYGGEPADEQFQLEQPTLANTGDESEKQNQNQKQKRSKQRQGQDQSRGPG